MITLAYSWVLNLFSWVLLCYFLGKNLSYLESKKHLLYYIFYFLNYLHICTTIIISYESKCYKCADSVQMKTDYEQF